MIEVLQALSIVTVKAKFLMDGEIGGLSQVIMKQVVIPPLNFTNSRPREFNTYSPEQHACVVYGWMVDGKTNRELDSQYLCPGHDYHGYQSMGILHYLGLVREHQGIFRGMTPFEILASLSEYASDPNYCMIFYYIRDYIAAHGSVVDLDCSEVEKSFPKDSLREQSWIKNTWTRNVRDNDINGRLISLSDEGGADKTIMCRDVVYHYSSQTIKESLKCLYDFHCQVCGEVILRTGWSGKYSRSEQWVYLNADVHHILPLSKHGPDLRSNMLCLCPTCHRKFHTGEFELRNKGKDTICVDQLLGMEKQITQKHVIELY